jgi:hypothetical protein
MLAWSVVYVVQLYTVSWVVPPQFIVASLMNRQGSA